MKNWIKLSKLRVKVHFEGEHELFWHEFNGFVPNKPFILTILIDWIGFQSEHRFWLFAPFK